jgi:hypothetical protein
MAPVMVKMKRGQDVRQKESAAEHPQKP